MDDTFTTPEYTHVPSLACGCKPRLQGVYDDGVLVRIRYLHYVARRGRQVAFAQASGRGWSP